MQNQVVKKNLERRLVEVVDFYRGIVLDAVEQECSGKPSWQFMRSRLLKAFGDRGLAGRLIETLEAEFASAPT